MAGLPADGSALLLGTVSFAGQIPTFLLAPFAGVLVDRSNRRKVLVWTQTLAMVQSLALAALTLTASHHHRGNPGAERVSGPDQRVRHARPPGVHGADGRRIARDLANAIAINSSMVNVARLMGPSLAGIVIAAIERGLVLPHRRHQLHRGDCFAADDARCASRTCGARRPPCSSRLREGWTYVSGFAPIRTILLLFALISLMGMPFMVLMPIFAGQRAARRPAHAGLSDGRGGRGRADLGAFAGAARARCGD